ncbi:glutamine amidotransferase [Pantoea stewartii]|uniref:glutamine amidotransferase n=1 Tax=Pantoea stewartii TaxID=66269 RepID=UPI0021E81A24|nr:glutamine amidotransferase [Pantoea stewartii]MEB6534491.1 glutamine amidotransferase [Pantoea stewartii]UYK98959.1 glutamine amidotransferase [Pantoea stewartii]
MTYAPALPLALIQLDVPPASVVEKIGEQPVWFIDALNLKPEDYLIVRPHLGEPLPQFTEISGAVLSGSWAMVTDHEEWSERTAAWVRAGMDAQLPLLGVCYGHQLMAYALGGKVADNPHGWERGLLALNTTTAAKHDPLLATLPDHFEAWLSHRQSVVIPPPQSTILAQSEKDPCQVLRYSPNALSMQFHPEFDRQIMDACLPDDVDSDGAELQGADWARSILTHFWLQTRPAVDSAQGA